MAEAFLKHLGKGMFDAESAGIEKGKLNPYVVRAMNEVGIDISKNETKEVFDLFIQGRLYQAVITLCDKKVAEKCPIFPGMIKRIEWSFPDPSKFTGTDEEILARVREVRDAIKEIIIQFIDEASDLDFWTVDAMFEADEN